MADSREFEIRLAPSSLVKSNALNLNRHFHFIDLISDKITR